VLRRRGRRRRVEDLEEKDADIAVEIDRALARFSIGVSEPGRPLVAALVRVTPLFLLDVYDDDDVAEDGR